MLGLFAATAVVATLMMVFALHHGEHIFTHRSIMIGMFLIFLPITFLSFRMLTGLPRPVSLFDSAHPVRVDGMHLNPGTAIYLMVDDDGPASLVSVDWCEATVDQLERAEQNAQQKHANLLVDLNKLATQPCTDAEEQSTQQHSGGNGNGGDGIQDEQSPFWPEPVQPYPPKD